jgi:2-phosphosulfolactate phosphatase
MIDAPFGQQGFDVRLEWGAEGVDALAAECGALVIVDVLSFSTAVDVAVARGARVLPLPWRDERAGEAAKAAGALLAGETRWSLRPGSLVDITPGTLLALPSPNGATLCVRAGATGTRVLAGCLRNARAVARQALAVAAGRPVGVVAAGERWAEPPGEADARPLRPSFEDQLGAGVIVTALRALDAGTVSREALAAAQLAAATDDPAAALAECTSGRELIGWHRRVDVELAAELDTSLAAPVLVDGVFTNVTD